MVDMVKELNRRLKDEGIEDDGNRSQVEDKV